MFSDVERKIKKRNQILFGRDSECLQQLIELVSRQTHRTMVMWALDCGNTALEVFEEKYPEESRPRTCLALCEDWARGRIKMPVAKRAILDAHAVAKTMDDREYGALCHAIGHAGATVHVETHGMGLPFYELTSLVLRYGRDQYQEPVRLKIDEYIKRLMYWQEHTDQLELEWATFLVKDKPNKEKLLSDRTAALK